MDTEDTQEFGSLKILRYYFPQKIKQNVKYF